MNATVVTPRAVSAAPTPTRLPLEVLLNPRLIQPVLHAFMKKNAAPHAAQPGAAKAACHILDAKYEPGKQCSILYELRAQLIIGELTWPSTAEPMSAGSPVLPTMHLYPFARDPALPALPTVMDGNIMRSMLNATLPECVTGDARIVRCRVTLLRYRLGKRCTLRYELGLRNAQTGAMSTRTLFGKLYHSAAKAASVYQEMQLLAAADRRPGLTVAKAVAYLPTLPLVLQAPVTVSAPLELLLQQPPSASPAQLARVSEGIRCAATALATLHESPACSSRLRSVDDELAKLAQRSLRIAEVDATTGIALHQLAQRLLAQRGQLRAWGEEITLVHGDCKPSQFFRLPATEMALLDFDHCGLADPAADVGNFLATLRQMGIKQRLKARTPDPAAAWERWLASLGTAFLDQYGASRPCCAAFHQRATWYQAMALLRKALRSYARSPRSPLAALLVQDAWQLLAAVDQAITPPTNLAI